MAAMWPSLWPKLSSRLNAKQIKDKDLKTAVSLLISDDTSSGKIVSQFVIIKNCPTF
jgi:hypothetical protein